MPLHLFSLSHFPYHGQHHCSSENYTLCSQRGEINISSSEGPKDKLRHNSTKVHSGEPVYGAPFQSIDDWVITRMWVLSPPHPSRDNGFLGHIDGVLPAPPQVLPVLYTPAPPSSFSYGQRRLIHGAQIGAAVLSSHGRYWPHTPGSSLGSLSSSCQVEDCSAG